MSNSHESLRGREATAETSHFRQQSPLTQYQFGEAALIRTEGQSFVQDATAVPVKCHNPQVAAQCRYDALPLGIIPVPQQVLHHEVPVYMRAVPPRVA